MRFLDLIYIYFIYHSGRFCHYDYGPSGNLLHYKTKTAPDYDLSRITAPTYVIYSKEDTLVRPVVIITLL